MGGTASSETRGRKEITNLKCPHRVRGSAFEPYIPPSHGVLRYVSYTPLQKPLTTLTIRHRPLTSSFSTRIQRISGFNYPWPCCIQFGSRCQGGDHR